MNLDANFSIKYSKTEFKSKSKISFTMTKLTSYERYRNGSTYTNEQMQYVT